MDKGVYAKRSICNKLNKAKQAKKLNTSLPQQIDSDFHVLQVTDEEAALIGDGVKTHVDDTSIGSDEAEDLLDYDDDLSDEDITEVIQSQDFEEVQVRPGTSGQGQTDVRTVEQITKTVENQALKTMMKKFFEDQFKDLREEMTKQQDQIAGRVKEGRQIKEKQTNRNKTLDGTLVLNEERATKTLCKNSEFIKSPSDTTVYVPALQKKLMPEGFIGSQIVNESNRDMAQAKTSTGNDLSFNQEDLISNFVDAVRMQQHPDDVTAQDRRRSELITAELEQAQKKAQKAVLEAEKFRVQVEQPGAVNSVDNLGNVVSNQLRDSLITDQALNSKEADLVQNLQPSSMQMLDIGSGVSDDDFFHLTCHIEPSLIHKIEKGEFVELEKLLPREKFGKTDEGRMEWVHRDGNTFLVPAQKDNKITGFRRWEQALRAYATIYCGANPHRSKEIWQYITVINTAALSYTWENVYNYDITFRHLMAFNPSRSWAVTYNQMWNLSMRDPIPKNFNRGGSLYQHSSGTGYVATGRVSVSQNGNSSNNPMQVRRNKSDYCWNFNKGVPCKFGNRCKFIERCKYCDSPSHGVNACQKLLKKENGGGKLTPNGATGNPQSSSSSNSR